MSTFSVTGSVNQGDTEIIVSPAVNLSGISSSSWAVIQNNKVIKIRGGTAPVGGTSQLLIDGTYPATLPNVTNAQIDIYSGFDAVQQIIDDLKLIVDETEAQRQAFQTQIASQGTAASRDVGVSTGDLLEVGAFGVGVALSGGNAETFTDFNDASLSSGFYRPTGSSVLNSPTGSQTPRGTLLVQSEDVDHGSQIFTERDNDVIWFRRYDNSVWQGWREIYHSGNLNLNTFGGLESNDIISGNGVAVSSTAARFYLPISSVNAPSSISLEVGSSFKIIRHNTATEITGLAAVSMSGRSSNMECVIEISGLSGLTRGEPLELRTESNTSEIRVNF